ncbi:unnamed protein product [Meloidogyne enterolobii]|uniref:Uncharacterized protein n=1 Tax=Meloidogyne enterolobii TaxID=390850 RepID=A0ACB1B0G2_MELEN
MLENSFSNNFVLDENEDVEDIQTVKEHLLKHFKIKTKEELMNILYGPNFQKSYIASFTKLLAECLNNNKLATKIFFDAGYLLAAHICAISKHFDEEFYTNKVSILLIGSVFKSWQLLRKGFERCLATNVSNCLEKNQRTFRKVAFYQPTSSPAIGYERIIYKGWGGGGCIRGKIFGISWTKKIKNLSGKFFFHRFVIRSRMLLSSVLF